MNGWIFSWLKFLKEAWWFEIHGFCFSVQTCFICGLVWLSLLIFNLLCSNTGKRRRDEQLRAMHSRKKMALFLPCTKYPQCGWDHWWNEGMVLFALASRALIKFCVMHWNVQTHWDIKYRWSFSILLTPSLPTPHTVF